MSDCSDCQHNDGAVYNESCAECEDYSKWESKMTNSDLQKVRNALAVATTPLAKDRQTVIAAIAILDAALAAPEPQPVAAPALDLVADQGFTIFPLAPDLPVPTYYWGGKGEIAEWMICPKCCGKFPISKETVAQLKAAQPAPVAAPEPQQPVAWVSVDDAMPKSGVTVLACYKNSHGNLRRIRAEWTAAKTVEANAEYDWGEYDEETDTYWTPEGWYECIDNWDEFSSIAVGEGEITHWMPLPLAPDDPNYTAPPSREWQGLSADEIQRTLEVCQTTVSDPLWSAFAEAIDAALKEKNHG